MQQLPKSCQTAIYTQFIFKDFLWQFRLFFNFNKVQFHQYNMISKENKFNDASFSNYIKYKQIQLPDGSLSLAGLSFPYPYWTFRDDTYCGFMIDLLNSLEFRVY